MGLTPKGEYQVDHAETAARNATKSQKTIFLPLASRSAKKAFPILVDVNVYRLDRHRGSRLVVDRHRDRHEFRFVRRRIVGEVDTRGLIGSDRSEAVMRNYGTGGNGDGVREVTTDGIRIFDDERNALRRASRDGNNGERRRNGTDDRRFRNRSDGCGHGDSFVGKRVVRQSSERRTKQGRHNGDHLCALRCVVLHGYRRNGYYLPPFSPCFMDARSSAFIFSRAFGTTNAT